MDFDGDSSLFLTDKEIWLKRTRAKEWAQLQTELGNRNRQQDIFVHDSLRSAPYALRLLRLSSTASSELPLQFELRQSQVETERLNFVALSYTWGEYEPLNKQRWILLNGHVFYVRKNLYGFLRDRAAVGSMDWFWIDAVCIDQNNVSERNHQVTIMKQIYEAAAYVHVWLGDDEFDHNWLLQDFNGFGSIESVRNDAEKRNLDPTNSPWLKRKDMLELLTTDPEYVKERYHKGIEDALNYISYHNYWRRLWVVQEFLLAKTVIIRLGNSNIAGERLALLERTWRPDIFNDTGFGIMFEARTNRSRLTLQQLLRRFANSQCQDPHDRIYALLGIMSDYQSRAETFQIDYAEPLGKLVERVMQFCGDRSINFAEQVMTQLVPNLHPRRFQLDGTKTPITIEILCCGRIGDIDGPPQRETANSFAYDAMKSQLKRGESLLLNRVTNQYVLIERQPSRIKLEEDRRLLYLLPAGIETQSLVISVHPYQRWRGGKLIFDVGFATTELVRQDYGAEIRDSEFMIDNMLHFADLSLKASEEEKRWWAHKLIITKDVSAWVRAISMITDRETYYSLHPKLLPKGW